MAGLRTRGTPRIRAVRDLSTLIQAYARFQQIRRRDAVCRHGITVSQCYALEAIVDAPRDTLTVTALAQTLGLNKSSASRVADSLAVQGLATVESRPGDARTKYVRATATGTALAIRIHRDIEREHARLVRGFSDRDLEACRRLMDALQRKATT